MSNPFPQPNILTPPSVYWNSFIMLYNDFELSLGYVHTTQDHMAVYSLKYYELLLRASTEFESICKEKVLELKLSSKKSDDLSIKEYQLLDNFFEYKLSKKSVVFMFSETLFVTPFESWEKNEPLDWYKSYNNVKHNRVVNFKEANLLNVLKSIAGLFVILEAFKLCPRGKGALFKDDKKLDSVLSNDKWPVVLKND